MGVRQNLLLILKTFSLHDSFSLAILLKCLSFEVILPSVGHDFVHHKKSLKNLSKATVAVTNKVISKIL